MTNQYSSPEPEEIEREIEVLVTRDSNLQAEAKRKVFEKRRRQIEQRSRSIGGIILIKLGVGNNRYYEELDEAYTAVYDKQIESWDEIQELRKKLLFAKFERKPVTEQTALVEWAAWYSVAERPENIEEINLLCKRPNFRSYGQKLELSYGVDLELPSLGFSTRSEFTFAGPRVEDDLPSEDNWLRSRGKFAYSNIYLTNLYNELDPSHPVQLGLDHNSLGQLTALERFDIQQAGLEAAARVVMANNPSHVD